MKKTNKKNKKGAMKINTKKVAKNVTTVGVMTVVGGAVVGSTIRNVQDITVLAKKAKAKHEVKKAERKEKKASKKAAKED